MNQRAAELAAVSGALAISGVALAELETFLVVSEMGSFSLAAKRLHLSQPAVTARVQKLEALLGVRLLNRTTRSVEVTEAGTRLAARTRETLAGLRDLIADFTTHNVAARSRVSVVTTPMLAATMLPRLISRYNARYPDVEVNLLDIRHVAALQSLECGDSDVGVMALDAPQPKLRFTLLKKDPIALVLPAGHPLAQERAVNLKQLARWPVMVPDHYAALMAVVAQAFAQHGLQFKPAVTAANLTTVMGMLDAGRGVALLPAGMAQHNAQRPRIVVPLADCELYRDYGIFTPRHRELNAAARSFVDFLQVDFAAAELDELAARA